MKKIMMAIVACGLLVGTFAHAADANYNYTNTEERMYLRLCEAVISNNKLKLHQALKRSGVSYKQMQEGLVCNGQDPITFAMLSGSEKTAHMIAARTKLDVDTILAKN
ncbi:DUF3718 domain-containing protein [Alteromonadaceae bacterium M269]|nr:DUF3718 domain-containing protein [Alteromonadaceae bacterium M269]